MTALGAAAPAGAVGAARVGEVSVYDLRYMLDEYVALNKYLFGDADQLVRELVRTVSTELVYLLETRGTVPNYHAKHLLLLAGGRS